MEKNNDHHNNLQSSPKANALHGETADTVFATEYMFPPELFELSEPILVKEDKEKQADVTSKKVAISETKTTTSKPSVQNLDIPHDKQLSAPLQPKVAKKEKQDQEEIKEAHSVELIFADANTDPPNDDMPEDSAGGNGGDSSAPNENPGQKKEQSATPSVTDTTSNSEVPEEVMSKMENSMGADFSQVKINTNSQLAKESNALAFTQGDKIDFAPGQFNPTSLTGQRLLGHELAHVLQQREGRVTANTTSNGMPVNDDPTLENEADALGDTAARASDTMQKKNGPLNPVDSVQEKSPLSNSVVVQNKNGAAAADPTVKSAKIKIIRKGGSYIVSGTYSQIRLQLNGKSDSGQTIPTYGKIATDWISADNKKCTVYVEVILTIKLPTWSSFSEYKKKASNPKTKNRKYYQKAVAAWKKYIKNLGVHEEGHFEKDSEYFSKLSEKLKGKKESKVGGTITQYGDNAAHVHDKYHDEVGHGVPALPYIQKEVEKVPSRNSTQSGDTVVGQEKSVANNSFDSHESSASPQQLKAQATLQLQSLTTQFSSNEGEGSMRKRIVALAKGEVGKVASSLDDGSGNKKGYERLLEYFNVSAPGIWDEQIIKESRHRFPEFPHWCGIFAIWAIKKAGRDVGNWKPGRGVLDSGVLGKTDNPQPGDIGYQQRQSHHALIIEVNGNTIKSVDGNSNMGEIQIRTRSKDDYQGFFTAWGGSSVQMKKDAGKVNDAREAIMPGDVMQKMEESFGTSFNDVNIHENSSDATNAGALAYAQGTDVHFAPGQFKPDTRAGQELIGHELAHVIQQKQGRVKPTTQFNGMNINADPSLEKEADDMGRKAATQITSSSMQFSKVTTNAGHSMSRNVSQQKAVIQRGDPEDAAPVYSPETSRPRVTYSLQGSRFTLSPNTQFAEGDKMPQGVEIILRYLIGQQFAAGDNTDLLVHLYTQVPNLAFSGYQGSASGGEVMIDFMIAPVVLISIVRWLENVKGFEGVRISQEQRELIDLGYFATSAFVDLHREEVVNRLGILPPEVDQGMFLAQIARRRPLLDAYISAVLNLNENPSEENREAVIHVLMSINDVFALTHMVLDELRNSESLTDHVAYTMLFGIPEGQEQSEDEEAPEPMSPMVIRDNVSRFYQWQPTQPLMSRKIAFGEATDEEKRGYIGKYYDYIGNTLGIRTPSGDQELTDAPGRATAPPLPSNLISSPAIVAPLYSAAISTDIPFIMRVNFPDVFEAFATPVEYVWEKIRIDPESMGQDVSEMNGEETSGYGDVASSRYRRTSEYNDTDIQRVWNTFDDSIGGTAAGIGAATLVEVNNILRYVGTSAGLLFDMVMDAKNLQRMVFEDEGFYMIRCRATPQYESDEERSVMRPPSVAYMPVYARARGEMARLALDASLQRDEINADRIAEIRELLVDQCPENEEALRAELSLLETGAGSIQGIYEQELANINTRIAEIRARFGEATYLNDEYRGLRNRKGDLIMLLGHSRERREEHDFTLAERIPGTFVADLGQTIHLQLEVIDESAPGASTKSYYISDLTTKRSGQATGVGRTKAAAIENGVKEIFESISGYGRGDLRLQIDGNMTESIRIDADAGQLLMEAVDNIVMTASMVAMAAAPFTGGASLQILIPLGAVGAGTSIYRLMHSSEMGTLHYDLNFAMEIINIASAFIPGIAAVAGVGSHFMVEGTLIILDGVNLMLVGVEAIHAIQNIDPSTPRELRNAQVARIIGNAGMQFGMTALGNVMGEIATRFEGPAAPNRTDPNSPHTDADAPNSSPESIPEGNNSTNHPDDSTTQNPHDDTSTRDQGEQHPDQEGRRTDADEPESTQVPEDSNTVGDDHTDQGSDAVRDPGGGTSLIPNSDLPTVNHTQSAESYLHDNEIRLLHREEIAMLEFLNTATSWREAMTILQARPEPRFRTIEQNIMTHRDNICNRLFYEFDAAPVSGASSTPISDVDLSITGANAGIKLIAAENFMRARFGDAWSALLRMNFYTEASRLTQYESVQSLMTPEQFGAFQIELTRISEQFNYAKMLQHAEGDPAQVASVHEMMSHVPPEIRARAEELAASPASSQTDRRNALLAEVDNLVVDFNTARDAGDQNSMIRLAEEITRKQVECNYLTDEAYIGPGAGRMVVNQVGVTGHEAYQSAISQLEMIQHTIHESGGLVPALRDYEIYKYLHRLCESIRVSENDTAYDRMSRMIYREERGYMQMHENITDQHLLDFYTEIMDYAQIGIRDLRSRAHRDSTRWTPSSETTRPVVEHPGEITRDTSDTSSYVVRESHGDTTSMGGVEQPQARYYANMTIDSAGFISSDVVLVRSDIPGHEGDLRRSVLRMSNVLRDAITHFQTNHTVNGIKGDWGDGTNLEVFNQEFAKLIDVRMPHAEALVTAALKTPTGRTASRLGFAHPVFENTTPGDNNNFTNVQVTFHATATSQTTADSSPVQQKTSDNVTSDHGDETTTSNISIPSGINIHQDSREATDMGAYAFARGQDVHFAPGQFKPNTRSGQELIGHEFHHVQQQKEGRVKATTQQKGIDVNDDVGLEKEADDFGVKFANAMQLKGNKQSNNPDLDRAQAPFSLDRNQKNPSPVQQNSKEPIQLKADVVQKGEAGVHHGIEHEASEAGHASDKHAAEEMYAGNWMRDFSQLNVPLVHNILAKIPSRIDGSSDEAIGAEGATDITTGLLRALAMLEFGPEITNELITPQNIGVYKPEEHMDNPVGTRVEDHLIDDNTTGAHRPAEELASGGEGAGGWHSVHPEINDQLAGSAIPGLQMENPNLNVLTSSGLGAHIFNSVEWAKGKLTNAAESGPTAKGRMYLGTGLHVVEDYFAHSNFIEVSLNLAIQNSIDNEEESYLPPTFVRAIESSSSQGTHVDTLYDNEVNGRQGITTGSFGSLDTKVSIGHALLPKLPELGELVNDQLNQSIFLMKSGGDNGWKALKTKLKKTRPGLAFHELISAFDKHVQAPCYDINLTYDSLDIPVVGGEISYPDGFETTKTYNNISGSYDHYSTLYKNIKNVVTTIQQVRDTLDKLLVFPFVVAGLNKLIAAINEKVDSYINEFKRTVQGALLNTMLSLVEAITGKDIPSEKKKSIGDVVDWAHHAIEEMEHGTSLDSRLSGSELEEFRKKREGEGRTKEEIQQEIENVFGLDEHGNPIEPLPPSHSEISKDHPPHDMMDNHDKRWTLEQVATSYTIAGKTYEIEILMPVLVEDEEHETSDGSLFYGLHRALALEADRHIMAQMHDVWAETGSPESDKINANPTLDRNEILTEAEHQQVLEEERAVEGNRKFATGRDSDIKGLSKLLSLIDLFISHPADNSWWKAIVSNYVASHEQEVLNHIKARNSTRGKRKDHSVPSVPLVKIGPGTPP